MPTYKYNTGDTVRYQPADTRQRTWDALIIGRQFDYAADEVIYDVVWVCGRGWAYEEQLTMIESHAGKVERQLREMLAVLR